MTTLAIVALRLEQIRLVQMGVRNYLAPDSGIDTPGGEAIEQKLVLKFLMGVNARLPEGDQVGLLDAVSGVHQCIVSVPADPLYSGMLDPGTVSSVNQKTTDLLFSRPPLDTPDEKA